MTAILIHIFYEQSWEQFIKERLVQMAGKDTAILINICVTISNKTKLINKIKNEIPGCYIIESPNIGKDIGGKLALIDLLLQINIDHEFIIFLHDKQSPQSATGENWRETLIKSHIRTSLKRSRQCFKRIRCLALWLQKNLLFMKMISGTVIKIMNHM